MRRILIDQDLKDFAFEFGKKLFADRDKIRFGFPLDKLNDLINEYSEFPVEQEVLKIIMKNYHEILSITPKEQVVLIQYFDTVFPEVFFIDKIINENGQNKHIEKATDFGNKVFSAFRYDALRNKEVFFLLKQINIKTCIYCNAQLTIVISKDNTNAEESARLDLDHYFPKSRYPYLSTSFFNLLPACANCNRGKSSSKVLLGRDFHLYVDEKQLDVFEFQLQLESLMSYLVSNNLDDLVIEFIDKSEVVNSMATRHNTSFNIIPIYNTQKDVLEELLYKAQAYTNAKKEELKSFEALFPNDDIIKRMIVGNYYLPEDIHKRPLAKFTQDIARQLKLI